MGQQQSLRSFNLQTLAEKGVALTECTSLQKLERLAQESVGLSTDLTVNWELIAELRTGANGQIDTWMHLQAATLLPLTCQRCLSAVQTPLRVDQWYRFVATEEVAMSEDDGSEEDLLVMTPQFDLLAVLEDELLMAVPLVPMHTECPTVPAFSAGVIDMPDGASEKPHPFAALARLKRK